MNSYTFFESLVGQIRDIPTDGIVSRTIFKDTHLKVVLFGFAAGQALSEHSAAHSAIIHILSGQATVKLGDHVYEVDGGAWVHMPPRLTHSITAITPVIMLLLILQDSEPLPES